MSGITEAERYQWRKRMSAMASDGHTESAISFHFLDRFLNDADRLAAIERQVLWRTEEMPESAVVWSKGPHGCYWWLGNNTAMLWAHDGAPDYRPDEPGPIWLPILDPPEHS